ncbi:MAG: hydroxymethylbilane synthase [Aigarchaeota archaeon]|nr:hydroxymethylbilane synthase [Aigarchaeota archaeon]MCX8192527.1 hydroxymethylbilane synthase [Nitrososphaeria archaeon]
MKLVVGTRGSKLSIIQTQEVINSLKERYREMEFEIKIIKTTGDIDLETPLYRIQKKGIFEKEIDLALINREIDFAVHSLKDYPTDTLEGIRIVAVPKRLSPYDALTSRIGSDLIDLPRKSKVGTSSLRREAFIKYLRKDLEVIPIRGNLDTRLKKMFNGLVDAIVVAEAGLIRLGERVDFKRLNIDDFTPPAGQGALAVIARVDDDRLIEILSTINDEKSWMETSIERRIISLLKVGCKTPIGVCARVEKGGVDVTVSTVSLDYEKKVLVNEFIEGEDMEKISSKIVESFKREGGEEIIREWRSYYD